MALTDASPLKKQVITTVVFAGPGNIGAYAVDAGENGQAEQVRPVEESSARPAVAGCFPFVGAVRRWRWF